VCAWAPQVHWPELLCTHGRGLTRQPKLELALQSLPLKVFFLKNLQSNFPSTPNMTRKPDQASEEVLASV